jgi:hypothetical protein
MLLLREDLLMQWPVKILLVHPKAEFMQNRKLTIAADCAVVVHKELASKFGEETIIIGCPMLEDPRRMYEKIKMIAESTGAQEIDVYTMEVPCCHAIHMMVERAFGNSGKRNLNQYIVRVSGRVEDYGGKVDESMIEAEIKAHSGGLHGKEDQTHDHSH